MDLEAGKYNVYVHLDRTTFKDLDYFKKGVENGWDHRKLSRVLTEQAKSRSITWNFKPGIQRQYLPVELSTLIKQDLVLYEEKKAEELAAKEKEEESTKTVTVTVTTTTRTTRTVYEKNKLDEPTPALVNGASEQSPTPTPPNAPEEPKADNCIIDPGYLGHLQLPPSPTAPLPPLPSEPPAIEIAEDENSVYLGLRVYTKGTTAVVHSLLRSKMGSDPEMRPSSPICQN